MTNEQKQLKDFYDFASYMISEGYIDFSNNIQNTINKILIEYLDDCKNNGYQLPECFDDKIDRWHVTNIIVSHLDLEIRFYQNRLQEIRSSLKILKEI